MKIKCLLCRDIIECKSIHNLVNCKSENCHIDGRNKYCRFGGRDFNNILLILYESMEIIASKNNVIDKI